MYLLLTVHLSASVSSEFYERLNVLYVCIYMHRELELFINKIIKIYATVQLIYQTLNYQLQCYENMRVKQIKGRSCVDRRENCASMTESNV